MLIVSLHCLTRFSSKGNMILLEKEGWYQEKKLLVASEGKTSFPVSTSSLYTQKNDHSEIFISSLNAGWYYKVASWQLVPLFWKLRHWRYVPHFIIILPFNSVYDWSLFLNVKLTLILTKCCSLEEFPAVQVWIEEVLMGSKCIVTPYVNFTISIWTI